MIPDEVQLFVSYLIREAIVALVPVFISFLVLLARKAKQFLEARLTEKQLSTIETLSIIAVRAAEQSGLIGLIENTAHAKKQYAVSFMQRALEVRGITKIDVDEISDWIEAAIRQGLQDSGVVEVGLIEAEAA